MSFNDLTKKSAELDKEKSDKKPEKDSAAIAPGNSAGKPNPKG